TDMHDNVRASKEEQYAWKAKTDPIQQEMRRLQFQLRRAPEEQKAKLEMDLEKLDEKMPEPLAAIYTVKDEPKQATPIHLLRRGDYLAKGDRVGVRPLGILLPEATP